MKRIYGKAGQDTDMIHIIVPKRNDFSDAIFIFLGVYSSLDDEISLIQLYVLQCSFSGTDKSAKLICHSQFPLCILCPFCPLTVGAGEATGAATEAKHDVNHL